MKISRAIKEAIAKKAAIATIAKRRDAAYKVLQKELTQIAQCQYNKIPLNEMSKYSEFIMYDNHLGYGKDYPEDFIDVEKRNRRQYIAFGFVPADNIPLLKQFPIRADEYSVRVSDQYANEYTNAVRKYMVLYFEAETNYKIILESLNTISTDKELSDEFPELLMFFTIDEDVKKPPVSKDNLVRCKKLLKASRQLFIESL